MLPGDAPPHRGQHEIEHRGRRVALDDGHRGGLRVAAAPHVVGVAADLEVLVLQGVRDLVRHGDGLRRRREPARDVERLLVGVVEARHLLLEQVEHRALVVHRLGQQPQALVELALQQDLPRRILPRGLLPQPRDDRLAGHHPAAHLVVEAEPAHALGLTGPREAPRPRPSRPLPPWPPSSASSWPPRLRPRPRPPPASTSSRTVTLRRSGLTAGSGRPKASTALKWSRHARRAATRRGRRST